MRLPNLIEELQHILDTCIDTEDIYLNIGDQRVKMSYIDFEHDKFHDTLTVEIY